MNKLDGKSGFVLPQFKRIVEEEKMVSIHSKTLSLNQEDSIEDSCSDSDDDTSAMVMGGTSMRLNSDNGNGQWKEKYNDLLERHLKYQKVYDHLYSHFLSSLPDDRS